MEETGRIIELIGNNARIEITPVAACSSCSQANVCNPFGQNKKIIELPNTVNGQVNDWVKIEIKEKNRILSTLLVLGLPILLFVIGVIIGATISGDATAAVFGGIGLILAFIITKIVNNHLLKKGKSLAQIKEKIEKDCLQ